MTPDARPIKTVSQIAAALAVPDRRAAELLSVLEFMGIAEKAHGGYRATLIAWNTYPRVPVREQEAA
jgi:hypothetical protein